MTIECWVKLESLPSARAAGVQTNMIAKWEVNTDRRSYRLIGLQADNKPTFSCSSDGTQVNNNSLSANTALSTGAWTHLAVTYKASTATITHYLNGVNDGSGVITNTAIHDNNSDLVIGAANTLTAADEFYDGLIDEVRIWNVERTGAQILANYNKQLLGNESGLVAYYKLNNDYVDSTANAFTLTASGSPVFSTDVPFVGTGDATGLQGKYW